MYETLLQPGDTKERCGVITLDGTAVEIVNVSEEPERSFEIEPKTFLQLVASGVVVATWHTHPDGDSNLSEEDRVGFLVWPDFDHIIIGTEGETRYRVEDGYVMICD